MKFDNYLISILLSVIVGCNAKSADSITSEDINQIGQAREISNGAIQKHDTATLASIWTWDYHVVTSRNFEVSGRRANRDRFASEFSSKSELIYVRTPADIKVFNPWNMAAETGTWTGHWKENEESIDLKGSYFAKWHKVNGRWLIRAEIFVPAKCSGGKYCDESPI